MQKAIILKNEIRTLAKGTSNGIKASEGVRNEIKDKVKKLEKLNPSRNPNKGKELDGKWS